MKCHRGLEDKSTFYCADFANSNKRDLKQIKTFSNLTFRYFHLINNEPSRGFPTGFNYVKENQITFTCVKIQCIPFMSSVNDKSNNNIFQKVQ